MIMYNVHYLHKRVYIVTHIIAFSYIQFKHSLRLVFWEIGRMVFSEGNFNLILEVLLKLIMIL